MHADLLPRDDLRHAALLRTYLNDPLVLADGLDHLVSLDGTEGGIFTPSALLSTFVVNSTADTADASAGNGVCDDGTGACTLRAAIQEANALSGADVITFSLGSGTPTISPATPLPDITGTVSIQGNTGGATRIEINGTAIGSGAPALKLAAGSSGSLLRSLVINRVGGAGAGIRIESASNTVLDSWIGLDATGSTGVSGNAGGGVVIPRARGLNAWSSPGSPIPWRPAGVE
jgi:CSLREA domain-containing protein